MGIRGLHRFLRKHYIMTKYNLCNTTVIIDGNNLYFYLYNRSDVYGIFGGNYDAFAKKVKIFFEQLLICGVKPIVIFDGGCPVEKIAEVQKRYKEKVERLQEMYSNVDLKYVIPSALMEEVFKEVLKELKISCMDAIFEADGTIATLAKSLACPVLSFDSDFYIYDVLYIPLGNIKSDLITDCNSNNVMKQCFMFAPQNLLKIFPDLNINTLPVLSALIGNDYCNTNLFTEFYEHLEIDFKDDYNNETKIMKIFNWLQNKTMDQVVISILNTLPQSKRAEALEAIELSCNLYTELPTDILATIGLSEEEITTIMNRIKKPACKYLSSVSELLNSMDKLLTNNTSFINKLPDWFRKELHAGNLTIHIIAHFTKSPVTLGVPMQDLTLPCCTTIIYPLIYLMNKLLTKGITEYAPSLILVREMTKQKKMTYVTKIIDYPNYQLKDDSLPSLHELRDLSVEKRMEIINKAIHVIPDMKIEELSEPWPIIVGSIIYWLKEDVLPKRNKFHVYALVFSMLYEIIDSKIGVVRSEKAFEKSYGATCDNIIHKQENNDSEQLPMDVSLAQAIAEVTKRDCLMIAKFFISKYTIDQKLLENAHNLNFTIVHVFNMFQQCLLTILNLNQLLGNVYKRPKLANMLKGTLFYNLYINFRGRINIDAYFEEKFKYSPSILRVFKILMDKIKKACDLAEIYLFKDFAPPKCRTLFYPFGA